MPIEISSLSVVKSKKQLLFDIDLSIADGEIVCVAGRNGAGKTTLLKTMLGMEPHTTGTSTINGTDMLSEERRDMLRQIGVMLFPDVAYDYLSGRKNLEIVQRFYDKGRVLSVDEVTGLVGLDDMIDRPVKAYSAGMKQRLSIAMALINNPTLLILDEPFNSVDQESTTEIARLIKHLNYTQGLTIILSTHALHEVESLYSRFVFIQKGRITFNKTKSAIVSTNASRLVTNLIDGTNAEADSPVATTVSLQTLYQSLTQ